MQQKGVVSRKTFASTCIWKDAVSQNSVQRLEGIIKNWITQKGFLKIIFVFTISNNFEYMFMQILQKVFLQISAFQRDIW